MSAGRAKSICTLDSQLEHDRLECRARRASLVIVALRGDAIRGNASGQPGASVAIADFDAQIETMSSRLWGLASNMRLLNPPLASDNHVSYGTKDNSENMRDDGKARPGARSTMRPLEVAISNASQRAASSSPPPPTYRPAGHMVGHAIGEVQVGIRCLPGLFRAIPCVNALETITGAQADVTAVRLRRGD
jgi:hypothetical protein